jgi:hypothetical protein
MGNSMRMSTVPGIQARSQKLGCLAVPNPAGINARPAGVNSQEGLTEVRLDDLRYAGNTF